MGFTDFMLVLCFWSSAAGVVYAYLGYPALIFALSRAFGRPPIPPTTNNASPPRVSLLIAAYNEAAVIGDRIRNALAIDFPPNRVDIVVASDGSDDNTVEICRTFGSRVRMLDFQERQGKANTLNASLCHLDGDIVVLSDANTSMRADAVHNLTRWFTDASIGAVCGRLVLSDPSGGGNADSVYWRYETFLKRCESRLGGLLGANGAIYAIRRNLLTPLPPGTVVDDFVIPLAARMRSRCRLVYDADAVAFEESAPDLRGEFRRRSRIGVGGFQALGILWSLLDSRHGWTAFTFFSHKVLRWVCPFMMIAALACAAALARRPIYLGALIGQSAFYALSAAGLFLPTGPRVCRLVRVCTMFTGMNLALLIGFFRWARGRQTGIWSRTARIGEMRRAA